MTQELNGRTYHIMNPDVCRRYFSRIPFAPSTSPDYFLVPKPAGTFRIFCLGGSTTVGFPYWYNGAFPAFLHDRLQSTFPDRSIEVINLGITATNSFTVLDFAEDVLSYEPDLLVVYDGHNEFYGALGAASYESAGGSRWLAKLSLALAHVRTYQFANDLAAGFQNLSAGEEDRGTMMERLSRGKTVPLGGETYRDGLDWFSGNLRALKELAADRGIPVLLGNQASNLRDLAPFISGVPDGTPGRVRLAFNSRFNAGMEQYMNGNFDAAIEDFASAIQVLPTHAEAHFRIAQCLDTLGRHSEALREYLAARDLDELRFRASSALNDTINAMDDGRQFLSVDIEKAFADASPGGIVGDNLILDHLHPTAYGNFLIAREYARIMRAHGLLADEAAWVAADTVSDETHWQRRRLTPLDHRIAGRRIEALVTAWPFQPEMMPISVMPAHDTLGQIADLVLYGQYHWMQGHDSAAAHYASRGDLRSLETEYRVIIRQLPVVDEKPYLHLAELLIKQERDAEARDIIGKLLTIQPDCEPALQLRSRLFPQGR
ncbi:MAG: tetratricopeptide repeat protein [Bacteroidetes bacterium]|nr:tetratricopeptide repeat protein [Bacteroidota bacterium]